MVYMHAGLGLWGFFLLAPICMVVFTAFSYENIIFTCMRIIAFGVLAVIVTHTFRF